MLHSVKLPHTMKFADKLAIELKRKHRSQEDLASAIGRAQSRISKWINGVGVPTPADLLGISRFLDVPLAYLCDDNMDSPEEATEPARAMLSPEEKLLWDAAHRMGVQTALSRILQVNHVSELPSKLAAAAKPQAESEPVRARKAVGRPQRVQTSHDRANAAKKAPRKK